MQHGLKFEADSAKRLPVSRRAGKRWPEKEDFSGRNSWRKLVSSVKKGCDRGRGGRKGKCAWVIRRNEREREREIERDNDDRWNEGEWTIIWRKSLKKGELKNFCGRSSPLLLLKRMKRELSFPFSRYFVEILTSPRLLSLSSPFVFFSGRLLTFWNCFLEF